MSEETHTLIDPVIIRDSHLLHDFDKIHAVRGALYYETRYPETQAGVFQQFFDYAKPKMKTQNGKAYMEDLLKHKDEMQTEIRQIIAENRVINETRMR